MATKQQKQAWLKVEAALKSGELVCPPACQACWKTYDQLEAHHDDYYKPLDVQWLCKKCHAKLSLVTNGRPVKYATAEVAAHNNLYSKMAGEKLGLSLDQFMHLATGKCEICGLPPQELLVVNRRDGRHELAWHYIIMGEGKPIALCKICKSLAQSFKMKDIISHCARIMARRMWKVHTNWLEPLLLTPEKPLSVDINTSEGLSIPKIKNPRSEL